MFRRVAPAVALFTVACTSYPVITIHLSKDIHGKVVIHFNGPYQNDKPISAIVLTSSGEQERPGYVPHDARIRFVRGATDVTTACVHDFRLSDMRTGDGILTEQLAAFSVECR